MIDNTWEKDIEKTKLRYKQDKHLRETEPDRNVKQRALHTLGTGTVAAKSLVTVLTREGGGWRKGHCMKALSGNDLQRVGCPGRYRRHTQTLDQKLSLATQSLVSPWDKSQSHQHKTEF